MSSIISILPDHIANQIAAGEVIQRPASVVKELVENAIDAGASSIQVHIKDAGRTAIQVIDDGVGMTDVDAENCFLRHATSKINQASDLLALQTKGFRGEALASIAAIAHVVLQTRMKDLQTGVKVTIEGSELIANEEVVCGMGSNFEIKNLFYNVPARRNFLKSNDIEFRHIKDEFIRVALAHPSVEFVLSHNGNTIYNLKGVVLRKRIIQLIGEKQNERLVPINEQTSIVKIHGFVLKPEFSKKTRGDQYFFVNDRFFKSSYFNHAVNKAFEGLIQAKSYPGYFIYFEIDPEYIDVNVHPSKTEIKFQDERNVYAILLSSIRQSLGKYNISPTLDFEQEQSFDVPYDMLSSQPKVPQIHVNPNFNPFDAHSNTKSNDVHSKKSALSNLHGTTRFSQSDWEHFYDIEEQTTDEQLEIEVNFDQFSQFIIRNPFVVFSTKSGMMFIHFKRAYERILFDEMMSEFILRPIASQRLLFPYEQEMSKQEIDVWNQSCSLLNQLGFEHEIKDDVLHLLAVPAILESEYVQNCLEELIQNLAFQDIDKGEIAHLLIAGICRNASKSKKLVNEKETVENLVETLFQCENHVFTPSDKLILKMLPINEIEQYF